jgi:hypothetical protein
LISTAKKLFLTLSIVALLGGALAACGERPKRLSQEQVLDILWDDFRPNTSSQNRSNWDNTQFSLVSGREAVSEFSTVPISQCPGPALPENKAIRASSQYWFIKVAPKEFSQTAAASAPTADERIIPEPLIQQASYLIDSITGEIVARRFFCER